MMRILKRGCTLLAALCGLAVLGAATGVHAQAKKIRIGYDQVPIHLAPLIFSLKDVPVHKGKRYEPDLIRFRGSSHQLTALAAGELDMAVLAFSTFGAGIVNAKQDIVGIADVAQDGPGFSNIYAVLDSSSVKSIEDLKGRVVAVNAKGGAIDMAARSVVLLKGLKPELDVTFIEGSFGAMETMLREGKTDVAVFLAPFWDKASATGGLRPLFHQRDGLGTTQFLLYAVKKDFLAKNRDLLVDVMEDYIRGVRWFKTPANREQAIDMIARYNKQDRKIYTGWALLEGKDYHHDADAKINTEAMQRNIDKLKELGILRESIDVKSHVDHSVVETAAGRVK